MTRPASQARACLHSPTACVARLAHRGKLPCVLMHPRLGDDDDIALPTSGSASLSQDADWVLSVTHLPVGEVHSLAPASVLSQQLRFAKIVG